MSNLLGYAVIAGALAAPSLVGKAKSATMTQAEQEQAAGDLVAGSVHLKPGGITGALHSAWDIVSPGGLDGAEAGSEYASGKVAGWFSSHLLVLALVAGAGYVAWRVYKP